MARDVALGLVAAFGVYCLYDGWRIIKHPRVPTAGKRGMARWNRAVVFNRVLVGVGLLVAVALVLAAG